MTGRSETKWLKTDLAALTLALLGALALFALPDGTGVAEASAKTKRICAKHGAVADAANNPGLVSDCAVLLDLKEKLEGEGGRELNWSSSLSMEKWDGVSLDGTPLRVTKIEITPYASSIWDPSFKWEPLYKPLKGKIPIQLSKLSELRVLDLYKNQLTGGIPPQLSRLSKLEKLFLSSNALGGKIPRQLSRLSELRYLNLSSNQLVGRIPKDLGDLSKLEELHLINNQLSGGIPKQLGKLSNLRWMTLDRNRLTGEIPKRFGDLEKIEKLSMTYNELSGKIPPELGELPNLWRLMLGGNKFTGCVPDALDDLNYFGDVWIIKEDPDPWENSWYVLPFCREVE